MAMEKTPYTAEYFWKDREGTISRTRLRIVATIVNNYTEARTKAAAMIPLMKALSGCHLIGYRVISNYTDRAVTGAGEAERKGKFVFISSAGVRYQTTIPGFKDALVDANGRDIAVGATAKPDVATFVNWIVNGDTGWLNGPVTFGGEPIVAVVSGTKIHVPSRRPRARRSG